MSGKYSTCTPVVVDGIEIELRRPSESGVIQGAVDQSNLGDRIAAIGYAPDGPDLREASNRGVLVLHVFAVQRLASGRYG